MEVNRLVIYMPSEGNRLRLTRIHNGQRYAVTVTPLGPIKAKTTGVMPRPICGTGIAPRQVENEYVPVLRLLPIPPAEAYGKCEVFRLTPRKLKSRLAKELRQEKREEKAREALAKIAAQDAAKDNAFVQQHTRVAAPAPVQNQTFAEKVAARKADKEVATKPKWLTNWLETDHAGTLPLTIACLKTCRFTESFYSERTGSTTLKPHASSLSRNLEDVWYLVENLAKLVVRSPKLDLSMHYCKCANCSSLAQPSWIKGAWNFELLQPGCSHDNGAWAAKMESDVYATLCYEPGSRSLASWGYTPVNLETPLTGDKLEDRLFELAAATMPMGLVRGGRRVPQPKKPAPFRKKTGPVKGKFK